MHRLMVSTWTVAVLLGGAGSVRGQEEAPDVARALIARAVKAHGGAEALGRVHADKVRFKGTLILQGHNSPFVAETTMQLPSKYRHVIEITSAGDKHTIIYVINGDKTYITVDGRPILAETQLAEIRAGLELERAKRLLPLLEDKSYQLALVEEIKVNDRPAVGVRITGRGRKEMRLYFDKELGLLVRAENRLSAGKDKEIRQHFFFGDFKDIGGYKRPCKVRAFRDGKEIMEAELLDAKALDRVDETEFAETVPQMSVRFFIVGRAEAGRPVGACLSARLSLSRPAVRRLLASQQVRVNGQPCLDPQRRLQRGQRVQVRLPDAPAKRDRPRSAPRPAGPRPTIRYADKQLVVVDKPAGLTTMRHAEEAAEFGARAKRFLPPTLADLLPDLLARRSPHERTPVRAVHRLDKDTSGLVVFARTVEAERALGLQFRAHTIERHYLAVVRGRATNGRIESWIVRDRGDGRRGSSATPGEGQRAVTHIRVVEELGDYTLVECRLETGRTHQVRIHLGEAGTPLCGERLYDRPLHGKPLPDGSGMKRVALHAAVLGFDHPLTGERLRWTSTLPRDLADLLQRLRRTTRPAE